MAAQKFKVDNDTIWLYPISTDNYNFTVVYTNKDTRALDKKFGLSRWEGFFYGSNEGEAILKATTFESLYNVNAAKVMRYFADLAITTGRFCGVMEEELLQGFGGLRGEEMSRPWEVGRLNQLALRVAYLKSARAEWVKLATKQVTSPGLETKLGPYLNRIKVNGADVLFPINL